MSQKLIMARVKEIDFKIDDLESQLKILRNDRSRFISALAVINELDQAQASAPVIHNVKRRVTIAEAIETVVKESPHGLSKGGVFAAIQNRYGMTVNSATLSVTMQRIPNLLFVGDRWVYRPVQNETTATPTKHDAAASNPSTTNPQGGQ